MTPRDAHKPLTVSQAAGRLGVTRARVHQLLRQLDIEPERVTGYDGQVTFLLSAADLKVLENRSKVPGPKKKRP